MDRRRKQNNRNDDSISAVEVEPQETIRGQSLSTVRHGMDYCEKEGIELLGVILTKENLTKALKRVETNKGVAGVDGIKTGELREYLKQEWPRIREELLEGNYKPSPVRRAEIRKPDGGIRLLGIPTVLDRMIQQAMTQVISPIFEKEFSNHSHGFRPGRKAHDAVLQAKKHIEDGYSWVVDIDLEKFFD